MARNKYPEETVRRILDIAQQLFLRQGYEETSMQDIVAALGMSKGAVYHHFHSKEELLSRVLERMHDQVQQEIDSRSEIGGTALKQLRQILHTRLTSSQLRQQARLALPLCRNPHLVVREMENLVTDGTPRYCRLIEAGNADGSMSVAYPYETAETLQLLLNFVFYPQLVDFRREEFHRRILFLGTLCAGLGIPVMEPGLLADFMDYYDAVYAG